MNTTTTPYLTSTITGRSARIDLWEEVRQLRARVEHLQREGNFKVSENYTLKKSLKNQSAMIRLLKKELKEAKKVTKL